MYLLVALVCGPIYCREVQLPVVPLPLALCQMQTLTAQALAPELQARGLLARDEDIDRVYCVPPGEPA